MAPKSETEEFYDKMKKSIVRIRYNAVVEGGGVFIQVGSRKRILTAAHVIRRNVRLDAVSWNGTIFRVGIEFECRRNDLGLLSVKDKSDDADFPCLKLCEKRLGRGLDLYLIGHPGRCCYACNIGKISSVDRTCGNIYYGDLSLPEPLKFTRAPNPYLIDDFLGMSDGVRLVQAQNVHGAGRSGGTGAPFLDSDGSIVGIYSFTFRECDYGIHASHIQQVLANIAESSRTSRSRRA